MTIGDIVFALRGDQIVAAGRVTGLLPVIRSDLPRAEQSVRMSLSALEQPTRLTSYQDEVLSAVAVANNCRYPEPQEVLAIPSKYTWAFQSLVDQFNHQRPIEGVSSPEWRRDETIRIMTRQDIDAQEKITLCLALEYRGELEYVVIDRDEDHVDASAGFSLELVLARIVPWEVCSDQARTDPDNYLIMDQQLAEHFSMGMVTFQHTGKLIHDPAINRDAFDPTVYPDFSLFGLTDGQKHYLAYHRKHVYKQWRTGTRKPMLVRCRKNYFRREHIVCEVPKFS